MDRSAPENGYSFGNKRQYRRDVWALAREWAGSYRANLNCLLMPSSEGDEVEHAVRAGFKQERMHLVDSNPAIAAHLKRRFPLATCHGLTLERVFCERIARQTTLDIVNLDLCGPISNYAFNILSFLATVPSILSTRALVFINVLRGREQSGASKLIRDARANPEKWTPQDKSLGSAWVEAGPDATPADRAREHMLFLAAHGTKDMALAPNIDTDRANRRVRMLRAKTYKSIAGNQTMRWLALDMHALSCACLFCQENERYLTNVPHACLVEAYQQNPLLRRIRI